MQDTKDTGHQNHQHTEPGVHDDRVMQRVTDGHKAVIGHHSQEEVPKPSKEYEKIHLCDAGVIGDDLVLCLYVCQHLGNNGCGKADVRKRQVGEEKIHGYMEMGIRGDGQDDKQVSNHSDEVHREEKPEKEGLQFRFS
jgi:hypothetical protein